ncbi:GNAT family N-acetyltransferase [Desulfitobacterium sp. PCE1]|uniref:GNAT family N-acetyltransferase n=1 Tax=Desulfitobacterium sp. PCE1 TaxID=146907 RepID=UPI0003801A75|nr:GNAT family N-acetyltransferase [Desulfitobacterium sp. PCE1]
MALTVTFGENQDENKVFEILTEYEMGVPGEIDEVMVVKGEQGILGGAKISEFAEGRFFLEVIGVRSDVRSQGVGGFLLSHILKNPWECSKYPLSEQKNLKEYTVSTLARGYALGFYQKMGFEPCNLEDIPEWCRDQCEECPHCEVCKPVPMYYIGGKE